MKRRTVLVVALALILLVSGVALAQSGGGEQSSGATLSGGRYRLVGASAPAGVVASGGGYRLLGPVSPSGGNPCCCMHLPCMLRNY